MRSINTAVAAWAAFVLLSAAVSAHATDISSANVPLDSPVYAYLEKLSGMGLLTSDIWGVRPFSRTEAARLTLEAEKNLAARDGEAAGVAGKFVTRLKELIPRETKLLATGEPPPLWDVAPVTSARVRYIYLDGAPRSYYRPVHDPGGDGVFGIGAGLRPDNPYPTLFFQRGVEATPLLEGNEGIRYNRGSNAQVQISGEGHVSRYLTALVEPLIVYGNGRVDTLILNKAYAKLGSGAAELEVGRDTNWIGPGNRTAITLSNNPRNLDMVKLSSPEPIELKYLGLLKYELLLSRLDRTYTDGAERKPWYYAIKLAVKPHETVEIGLNLGRQQGGPGVRNTFHDTMSGLFGETDSDNSNSVAGIDLRWRIPWLRNSILYGEYSGEDTALFWPIVESYVAGVYVPNLTADGKNELRFEYYYGNQVLSTSGNYPEGYVYRGLNLGPFAGGASQQYFVRYTHYFTPRLNLSVDYLHTERGNLGRVKVNSRGEFDANGVMQAVERANAGRLLVTIPLEGQVDLGMMYGAERITNFNLVGGVNQTNHLVKVDISYRY